jgi:hypothetical protein
MKKERWGGGEFKKKGTHTSKQDTHQDGRSIMRWHEIEITNEVFECTSRENFQLSVE